MRSNVQEAVFELAFLYGLLALYALVPIALLVLARRKKRREIERRRDQEGV